MSEKTVILSAKEGSDFKKNLGKVDELIKDTILRDSNKNKLYKEAKEHNEKTYKKMMMSLKDILSPVEESHQFLETLSPVLEFKDSPRRSPRPVLTTSKSTPRLNSAKDIWENSSPLLSFKHSPKKWDVRDDISSFLLNRSQTPNSTSGGVKLDSKVQQRKLHGRLASAHSVSTKELRLENSLNKAMHQPELQEGPQDLNKMISCVKVYGKNFIDAANRIKDVSLRGEKPRDLYLRNFEECENAFENQLNELSEKTSQVMKTGTISSPIFSLESFYAKGHNSLLSSPTGYTPLEPFLDDLTRGNEKNSRVKVLVDKYEQTHGSVDLRGSQVSTALLEGSKKGSTTFSQSSPDGFFGRSSSLADTPNLLQTKSQANFNREGQNFKEMNEILIQENSKLLKVIKKLQSKSEERKNNLKEIFKLLTSKDEELRQLKAQAQVESSLYMIKFEEIFKLAEQKLKEKYLAVEENLVEHESKLQNIEARLFTYKGATQGSARTTNNGESEPQEYNKTIGYGDTESLLETIKYLESRIHSVTQEKKEFEEKCNLLIKDLELIQEHKKKLELNYQEELLVQNEKIVQITGYAESLEVKYNKHIKEQITPIKQRRSASVKPEGELYKRNHRDMIDADNLVQQISKKLQNVCQKLGYEKLVCENMGPLEKISKIQEAIKKLKRQEGSEDSSSSIIQKTKEENQDLTRFCSEILDLLRDHCMVVFEESLNWNTDKVLKKLNTLFKESSERKDKIARLTQELEKGSQSKVSELEDINKKLGKKEKEISESQEKIARLTQELEAERSRASELGRAIEDLNRKMESKKKEFFELNELLKSKQNEIEKLNSLNSELQENNLNKVQKEELKEKNTKKRIEEMDELVKLKQNEIEKLSSFNSQLQENHIKVQKEMRELQDKMRKKIQEIESLKREKNELIQSKQNEMNHLNLLKKEIQELQEKNIELKESNIRLQGDVQGRETEDSNLKRKMQEIESLRRENNELIQSKQREMEKLNLLNVELKENNLKLQREIEKLGSLNTELQENNRGLKVQKEELNKNNMNLKLDNDELNIQIDKLTSEIIVLERNQLELQETINKKNAVYAQLKRDFDELKSSLDGQNKNILLENQDLREEKRKIENQLKNVKEEKTQIVLKLENENQELVQKMNNLLGVQEQYKRDLSLKSDLNKTLELQIAELNKNLQKKDSTLKSKTTEIEEARSINKHLTAQNHQQIEKQAVMIAETESKLAQLRGELKSTKEAYEKLLPLQEQVQGLEKMNQEQKVKIEGYLNPINALERDCSELKEKLKKKKNDLASISEEIKTLKDENLRLKSSESELLIVKEALLSKESQMANLSNEVKTLNQSNEQLKQEIKQKNMEECEMKQELEMERDANSKLKEELNKVNAYLKGLEEGKISTEQQLLLKKKVDDLVADKENVRNHLSVLEVKLKERQTTIEKLKLEMQEKSTDLQGKLNDKEKQIAALEAEVGRKADLSNLMAEKLNEIEKDHQKLSEINKNLSKEKGLLLESQEDFGKSLISLIQSLDNTRDSLTTNNLENLKILEAKIIKITQKVETQKKEAEQRIQDEKKKITELQKSIESELFLQKEENQKLSLELQALKEEKDKLHADNILLQVKSIQSVEISPQLQAITPDDDRSQETLNGGELKKAKSLCHQDFELAVKRREEIEDLSLVTRDRQRSVASKNVAFIVDDKSQEDYEKRLEGLRKEIEMLQVKKTELEKEPENLRLELGKVKSELLELRKSFKDRESFELSPEPLKVFTFKEGESSDKVEKLRNDNKRLREHRQLLKDENDELRKSFINFQVQIVNLSEKMKNAPGEKKDENEIIEAIRESLVNLCTLETLQGRLEVKLGSKKEVQETMALVKQAFEENEEDIVALVKELEDYDKKKAEYEKQKTQFEIIKDRLIESEVEAKAKVDQANEMLREEKKRLNEEIEYYENNLYDKLSKINHAIDALIKENNIADLSDIIEERIMSEGFVYLENRIYKNLGTLKEFVVMAAEIQDNYEKLVAGGSQRKPKASIQDDIDKAGSIEREELGESGPDTGDFSHKIKTIDEVQRILSGKDGRTATFGEQPIGMTEDEAGNRSPTFQNLNEQEIESNESRTNKNLEVSEIKTLYDQIRSLQDENEKLQIENKQLENDFTLLKFTCDELKADIMDKEEQIRNLNLRLPDDLPSFGEPKVSAEKEHIKAIFLKFMQSAFDGEKESALELLRLILNLLQAPESEQTKIIEGFKQSCSSSKKGGVFKKLFKK